MSKVEPNKSEMDAEPSKYGPPKEFDPTFNGPIKNRGCTDVICCILFLLCFLGMFVVGYFAYSQGDPTLLLYPTDSSGNLCGYGNYLDRPNLFFFDLIDCAKVGPAIVTNGCPTKQICVKDCPSTYFTWYIQYGKEQAAELISPANALAVRAGRASMLCDYDINVTSSKYATADGLKKLVENGSCASYYYPQEPVLGRCLPSFISDTIDKSKNLIGTVANSSVDIRDAKNSSITIQSIFDGSGFVTMLLEARSYGEQILQDLNNSKWFILVAFGLAMVVTFLWIIVMRWIAGFIVWFTIICFVGLFAFASSISYIKYYEMKNLNTTGKFILTTNLSYYLSLKETWLAFACGAATILLILVLVILFLRQRILIAIALIKEGSRAVGMMMFTLLWPIWPFLLQLMLLVYWGATCLFLASVSRKIYGSTNSSLLTQNNTYQYSTLIPDTSNVVSKDLLDYIPCSPDNTTAGQICSFVKGESSQYTIYLQIYMLFMLFWVMNFIIGFGQMVLAGAFASYYWAFDKSSQMPTFPIVSSLGRTLLYHVGSIAFGALIIAIVQMIRVGLEYLDHKLKGSENAIAKFLLKCLKCCFYCLEKFLKMINKNAYILIAIYGKNFCTAAKDAFFLIMRNIIRVAVVDKVTDFLLFIGKLVVTGALTVLSFYFFNGTIAKHLSVLQEYQPQLNYYFIPIIVIALGSFVIAACFFSVYGMAVDTLFLCFLEDLERNDGSVDKPYYMSKELLNILGKKNEKIKKEKSEPI